MLPILPGGILDVRRATTMMSYNVGVHCCRFCQCLMTAQVSWEHMCRGAMVQTIWYLQHGERRAEDDARVFASVLLQQEDDAPCPQCGHPKTKFHCGTPSADIALAGKYVCYCPPELRMHSFDDDVADFAKFLAGPRADFRRHCATCGAPLNDDIDTVCPYCNFTITRVTSRTH